MRGCSKFEVASGLVIGNAWLEKALDDDGFVTPNAVLCTKHASHVTSSMQDISGIVTS